MCRLYGNMNTLSIFHCFELYVHWMSDSLVGVLVLKYD